MHHLVFINDRPLIIYPVYEQPDKSLFANYDVVSSSEAAISEVVKRLERKAIEGAVYLCNNPDEEWKQLFRIFILIEASGGLIQNEKGEYLLILRKGKWDLPKGKIEYDEKPESAAIREVQEECGIQQVEIVGSLPMTFHTYTEKSKKLIKKTHWFLMKSNSDQSLVPQTEEDIEDVCWMSADEIKKVVFSKTYNSIKSLLKKQLEVAQ